MLRCFLPGGRPGSVWGAFPANDVICWNSGLIPAFACVNKRMKRTNNHTHLSTRASAGRRGIALDFCARLWNFPTLTALLNLVGVRQYPNMSQRKSVSSKEQDGAHVQPQNQAQNKQAILLAQDTGHFSLIKAMHLADVITEMNGFCGFMAVLSAMRYCLGDPADLTNLWLAFFFMPFGLFFDFFDGKVARWRKKSSLMGQELDSLADLISFGVAPAAVGFAIGFRTFVDQVVLSFYVLCGLTRLARFNVTVAMLPKDKTGKSKYFEGTPIPFACLTSSAIMAIFTTMGLIHQKIPFGLAMADTPLEFHPAAVLFIINGCLMTSKTLKVPKP